MKVAPSCQEPKPATAPRRPHSAAAASVIGTRGWSAGISAGTTSPSQTHVGGCSLSQGSAAQAGEMQVAPVIQQFKPQSDQVRQCRGAQIADIGHIDDDQERLGAVEDVGGQANRIGECQMRCGGRDFAIGRHHHDDRLRRDERLGAARGACATAVLG